MAEFNRELLQLVIDTSGDIIFVKDKDGRYILVNKRLADIYQTTADNMIGKTDWDLIDENILTEEKAKRYSEADDYVIESQKEYFVEESPLIADDGTKTWIQTRKKPITIDGDSKYVLGIVQNITELKEKTISLGKYKDHLKLINKILRHDLTNHFILLDTLVKNSDCDKTVEMRKTTQSGLDLLLKMREMEKFLGDHPELAIYDLKKVITKSLETFSNIKYTISGNAKVFANQTIYSVFENLTRNAIVHGKATQINVTIEFHNKTVQIKFADNGKGIPNEIKGKIFEERFKYGETGHSGLGLFIVDKAVKSFGGYVYVEDNKPKGATFFIVLRKADLDL